MAVVHANTVGLARAQNEAIRAATSDLVVFTDDDVLVDPEWLAEMTGALAGGGPKTAVTGRVLATEPEGEGGRAIALATDPEPAVYEGRVRRDVLSGNSMGFHRSAFSGIGLFDERLGTGTSFGSASDNDFGYRLLSRLPHRVRSRRRPLSPRPPFRSRAEKGAVGLRSWPGSVPRQARAHG